MTDVHLSLRHDEILTANQRLHWAIKARKTRALRQRARYAVQRLPPINEPVRLVVNIGWPDARRRDAHNIMPTLKACIDGMVDGHLLVDDSDRYLVGPDLRATITRHKKHIDLHFHFTPIGDQGD